jgi:hypothetical protein
MAVRISNDGGCKGCTKCDSKDEFLMHLGWRRLTSIIPSTLDPLFPSKSADVYWTLAPRYFAPYIMTGLTIRRGKVASGTA